MSARIFISYRKEDGEADAGRVCGSLRNALGDDCVFMDSASIAPGARWPEEIQSALAAATTIVAVMGPAWLRGGSGELGQRRIDDEDDWVRQELSRGFKDGKRVIPVLVRDARMPSAADLPSEISGLSDRQALELRHDHWDHDVKELIDAVRERSEDTPAGNALADLRRAMLAARSARELHEILYGVERILAQDPFSEEGRLLKDSLEGAIAEARSGEGAWEVERPRRGMRRRLRSIAIVAAVVGLGIGAAIVGERDGWRSLRFNSCRGVVVNILEPESGDHVSSRVEVSGTGTVRSTCRAVILVVRHRSTGVWTIADVGKVDDDGRWRAVAKLGESPDGSGDVEIAAWMMSAPPDYRPGASFSEPPTKGVASNTVHIRRIE